MCNISYYIDAHEILTFPSEWKNSISSSVIKTLVWRHRSKVDTIENINYMHSWITAMFGYFIFDIQISRVVSL
jgi:hypothetical protein